MAVVFGLDDQPVEIGPGRGDLRRSSIAFDPFMGGPFHSGRPVSYANIFRTQQWVAIAVQRLLWWSVRVPLKAYRRVDDDEAVRLRPKDHRLAAALEMPWDRAAMFQLVTGMLGPLLVHGNGLTDVHEGAGGKLRFDLVDWRCVNPLRLDDNDPNAEILGWKIKRGNDSEERSSDTVMHLRSWSPLGPMGISPLEQIRASVLSEEASVKWALNQLRNGVRPSGVVEVSDEFLGFDPAQRGVMLDNAREDLRDAYSGEVNAGKLPLLPPGLKWVNAEQTTAVEAELINQRFVNRTEVAAIYMIPPPMIAQLEKASFNNIATQREMAYTDGLAPPLVCIEQTMTSHLVRGLLREDDVFVQFDFGHILRGVGMGLMIPNEGREILRLPRYDHPRADKLWMPMNNLKPIDWELPVKGASVTS
jgi:HK97 family phage portal protein